MDQFEELQALWASQPVSDASGGQAATLAARLKRYGRREVSIGVVKLAVVSALLAPALWWLVGHPGISLFVTIGTAWCAASIVAVLALQWAQQRAIARLDYAAASSDFVRTAIDVLQRHQASAVTHARLATGALVIGLNLVVFGAVAGPAVAPRVTAHLIGTALLLVAFAFGVSVRRKRAAATCGPLVRQLSDLGEGE